MFNTLYNTHIDNTAYDHLSLLANHRLVDWTAVLDGLRTRPPTCSYGKLSCDQHAIRVIRQLSVVNS